MSRGLWHSITVSLRTDSEVTRMSTTLHTTHSRITRRQAMALWRSGRPFLIAASKELPFEAGGPIDASAEHVYPLAWKVASGPLEWTFDDVVARFARRFCSATYGKRVRFYAESNILWVCA